MKIYKFSYFYLILKIIAIIKYKCLDLIIYLVNNNKFGSFMDRYK